MQHTHTGFIDILLKIFPRTQFNIFHVVSLLDFILQKHICDIYKLRHSQIKECRSWDHCHHQFSIPHTGCLNYEESVVQASQSNISNHYILVYKIYSKVILADTNSLNKDLCFIRFSQSSHFFPFFQLIYIIMAVFISTESCFYKQK